MSLVVPFDGSDLSKTALVRAAQFGVVFDEPVLAVSVIPQNNTTYAREHGWIDATEPFDADTVVDHLHDAVTRMVPDAEFHHIFVDRNAPRGTIATKLRQFARNADASIVFVGSSNAGRIVRSLSVGSSITADPAYDTFVVSSADAAGIDELEDALSTEDTLTLS